MNDQVRVEIQDNLEDIMAEIDLVLANKGFGNFNVKYFKLVENETVACQRWKLVCNKYTGVCQRVCLD